MKRLAAILLAMLLYATPAIAQEPSEIAGWVFEQMAGIEAPVTIDVMQFSDVTWALFLQIRGLKPTAEAMINREDVMTNRLVLYLSPKAHTDFHVIHETVHYVLSKVHGDSYFQAAHSEISIHGLVSTLLCGSPIYTEWKEGFEEGFPIMPAEYMCGPYGLIELRD